MITMGLWEETNKQKPLAIAFSILLTPLTIFADIICPFINVVNLIAGFDWIFNKINENEGDK